jgi:hypothetical protein
LTMMNLLFPILKKLIRFKSCLILKSSIL